MHSQSPVTTRRAGPRDYDVITTMAREIAAHEGQLEHITVTSERWREVLRRGDVIVLLAEQDGLALGYVSAVRRLHLWSDRDVVALDDLYVREQSRGTGVGRMLMVELAGYAAPEKLAITWGVEVDNHAARRFYTRLGATLRPKIVAGWTHDRYADVICH